MEKISIQEISEIVARESKQTKKFSEQFVRELVGVIAEYLQKDGIAKVKGLGTFKVIAVEERKSVDVASGNEIILPAHNKVQFTPESAVKEEVNKPFEHLQTTVLESPMSIQKEQAKKPEGTEVKRKEEKPKEKLNTNSQKSSNKKGLIITLIVIINIILLCVLAYYAYQKEIISVPWLDKGNDVEEVEPVVAENPHSDIIAVPDTEIVAEDTTVVAEQQVEEPAKFDINSYNYKMAMDAPVREVVTVIDGSRLTMVAFRAYGSKDFWVYVYDANRDVLRRPSDIAKGMELKIADLPAELVDPNNPECIEKAKELAEKY
ncbi:MAG: HU family DNA-binding protein [Paludibacteraceae bacterium]|nr:HU family DNA-binding protein [Paludibacteraceae bacterium]